MHAVRRQAPSERIVLAVPVCSPQASDLLRTEVDELVCLHCPSLFTAVGLWYERFDQLSDQDVLTALHSGAGR